MKHAFCVCVLLCLMVSPARAALLAIDPVEIAAGDSGELTVRLVTNPEQATAIMFELGLPTEVTAVALPGVGTVQCNFPREFADGALAIIPDRSGRLLRGVVLSFDHLEPIPAGTVLMRCRITVVAGAEPGQRLLHLNRAEGATCTRESDVFRCVEVGLIGLPNAVGIVTVLEQAAATESPTPTATPVPALPTVTAPPVTPPTQAPLQVELAGGAQGAACQVQPVTSSGLSLLLLGAALLFRDRRP